MKRLVDEDPAAFVGRGTVFRVIGSYPHEKVTHLMLIKSIPRDGRSLTVLVLGGHKGGLPLVGLPASASVDGNNISCAWIIENWEKWIYPTCEVGEVFFCRDVRELFGRYEDSA